MENVIKDTNAVILQNRFFDCDTGQLLSPIETQNYIVVQAAESFYRNSFQIGTHLQYCDFELTVPLTGGMVCAANGKEEIIAKNEIYLSVKGETHALKCDRGCRFQTFAVNFKDPHSELFAKIQSRALYARKFYIPHAETILAEILSDVTFSELPFSADNLDALIKLILIRIARHGTEKPDISLLTAEETLTAVISYIDAHYLDMRSLTELSVRFGYTYNHICKIFRARYHISPGDYLMKKKFEHACLLLKEGKQLETIAAALGYSSACNFSRAFKKRCGISPGKYKAHSATNFYTDS